MEIEEPLEGGFGGLGEVVRIGDTIRRPPRQSTVAVRALLIHLQECGFDGAPRYRGTDEQGREVLDFLDGDVPLPPYPEWWMADAALESMGELVRRFHAATRDFDASAVSGWELDWADPGGGPVMCHNDLFPENVVFRDGRAVALIDFDMAAPGRPFWDLGVAAQEWIPLHAPGTRVNHPFALDSIDRFGRFVARLRRRRRGRGRARRRGLRGARAIAREHPARGREWRAGLDGELAGEGRSQRGDRRWMAGGAARGVDRGCGDALMELTVSTVEIYLRLAGAQMIAVAERLGDERVNQRPPGPNTNSVAALITHCCGVAEFWFGCVGLGRATTRDRDAELVAGRDGGRARVIADAMLEHVLEELYQHLGQMELTADALT